MSWRPVHGLLLVQEASQNSPVSSLSKCFPHLETQELRMKEGLELQRYLNGSDLSFWWRESTIKACCVDSQSLLGLGNAPWLVIRSFPQGQEAFT